MDNDQNMHSDNVTSVSESNLGSVMFSDYSSGNLILTSDIGAGLSSFEGTLCFDETNNELVYVNMPVQMISSNIGNSDSIPNSNSAFSSYGATSYQSLSDLPLFNDGGQVMLFTGGSIVIPNDDENLIPSNSDPFVLEYVLNGTQSEQKLGDYKTPVTIDFTETVESEIKQKKKYPGARKDETIKNAVGDAETKRSIVALKKNMKHSCKLCFEKFGSLKDYKKHLSNHNDHKMHECKLCGVSFNKINNLVLHEVTHSNDTKCPLLNCQKKFNRKASLKAHVKLHEEDESLTCPECGEEFRNQLYLELHYKYQSQCRISSFESAANSSQIKTFLCKLCDRNFERIETFNAHKKEHEKLKKALATKSHKKKSAPTVPSSRINRCKMCPKWFLKPSQLVRHMRIHTGERPFVCNVCDKAFNQANSLKIHMLKHTGDRPFQCPFCGTSFSQRGNLRQHINRVHSIPRVEEKVYKCSECPCMFKKMCSLNAHKNRVHQQLYANNGLSVKTISAPTESESAADFTEDTAITIENGVDEVNDEDMTVLLNRDCDINTIGINFDNGNGTICNQKVFVKKKGNTRYYRCSHCPKENVKLKEIIRHLKFSILGKPFRCDRCSKTFSQRSTFLTHSKLHVTAETYQCAVCERSFSNPLEMKIHSKLHSDTIERQLNTNSAPFCNNQVNNLRCTMNDISLITNLDAQMNSNAAAAAATTTAATTITTEKKFRTSERARLRDTVNLILPPYDCKFCQVGFESYTKLKQHLRGIHDVAICQNCCPRFSNKTKIEGHAATASHLVEVLHDQTCSKSDKKFRTKNRRDPHDKSHCKDFRNDVECQLCGSVLEVDVISHKQTKRIQECQFGRHRRHLSPPSLTPLKQKTLMPTTNNKNAQLGSSADDDVVGGIRVQTAELTNAANLFADGAAVARYDPCDVSAVAAAPATSIDNRQRRRIIDQTTEINVANDGNFPATNTAAAFTAAVQVSISHVDNDFSVNETSLFNESRISVNENVENSIDLTDNQLKTELMTLDSIEDNLFEFQPNVMPAELDHVDATVPSNGLLNSAGAVIYKSTKCYPPSFAEIDAQKQSQEVDCHSGETNTIDSYFYACNTCYLTFKNLPTLLKHLQTHDGSKSFECLYCGKENKTQAQLTHHIAQHSLHKEFPCVHCGELFDSLNVVKKHITDIHLMSSVDKKSEQKRKKNSANDLLLSEKQKIQIACQKPHKYSSISEKVLSSLLKNNVAENAKNAARAQDKDETPFTKKNKSEMKKIQKENICSYCSRGFKKMCDLVRHIRIHTGEKPFKCDYCSKCFTVKSILNCHLKTHFSVNNIFCHVCNRFFATVGSLKTHMRLHTGERPYKCLYCKETFRTSGHRDSHQKRHLGDKDKAAKWKPSAESALIEIEDDELGVNLEPAGSTQDAEFIIPDITDANDFKFQDIDLSDLSSVPANKRSHCCIICRKTFKKKSDLDRHISTHANERAYRCEICDSRFNQENTFKTHLRKHTRAGDQVCSCDQCGSTFASVKNLKTHKVRHHPETSNAPVKDVTQDRRVEIIEMDKNVDKWRVSADIFPDKIVDMKKYDGASDFYCIDRHFDLNTMMQDLFPDDEKE